ncbi:MAG: glycosyl hydrolase family 8 [Deltaproteobacteria bacterium]
MTHKTNFKYLVPFVLVLLFILFSIGGVFDEEGSFTDGFPFSFLHVADTKRPFPQHVVYAQGTIKPNVDQQKLDEAAKAFYDDWKARYLKNDCGSNQYYTWFDSNQGKNNAATDTISVSEGQGYGMIIVAYMAGYDRNAKKYFDGLYSFYKAHRSKTAGSVLMAWNQVVGCHDAPETGTSNGNDSATDADMDIAYALLLADRQWGSGGAVNYLSEAQKIIKDIMHYDINPFTRAPKLGNWAFPEDHEYFATRSSDLIMDHFRAFQNISGDKKWGAVIDKCYYLIERMQKKFSPRTGLLPDFIVNTNGLPGPAGPNLLESAYDGSYYLNACRTPWRIATDYLVSGDIRAKRALDRINSWFRNTTKGNPELIKAGYHLSGENLPGNDYMSAEFVAPLAVSAMVDAGNQRWLDRLWSFILKKNIEEFQVGPKNYYENTLKLLALITLSGNWWAP